MRLVFSDFLGIFTLKFYYLPYFVQSVVIKEKSYK